MEFTRWLLHCTSTVPDQIGIWKCWFFGGWKIGVPGENPQSKDKKQQQP